MREPIMDQRIKYGKLAPEGIRALDALETYLRGSGLDPGLLDLIKTRASQLNGSTPCQRGMQLRSTPIRNEPRSPGPMP
jgi:alkylhydroperoxidase family enzyme